MSSCGWAWFSTCCYSYNDEEMTSGDRGGQHALQLVTELNSEEDNAIPGMREEDFLIQNETAELNSEENITFQGLL